jgi:hypothetical protein
MRAALVHVTEWHEIAWEIKPSRCAYWLMGRPALSASGNGKHRRASGNRPMLWQHGHRPVLLDRVGLPLAQASPATSSQNRSQFLRHGEQRDGPH